MADQRDPRGPGTSDLMALLLIALLVSLAPRGIQPPTFKS
jgi:hypothetical protein